MSVVPPDSFDFYLNLAKPLVLNLADASDRIVASAWVQKLRDSNVGSEQLRTDYLKLLLFVLQRARIIGPFKENPNNYDKLEEFPANYKLHDVAKELLEAEEAERRQRILRGLAGPSGDYPPFTIEYSSNLLEYSAAQDIPNFGVHAFYALSKEPLSTWDNLSIAVFPKGIHFPEESVVDISVPADEDFDEISVLNTTAKSRSRSHGRSKSTLGITMPDESGSPDVSGDVPKYAGTLAVQIENVEPEHERVSPTWGSNLGNVIEAKTQDECPCSELEDLETEDEEDSFLAAERALGIRHDKKSSSPTTVPLMPSASTQVQRIIDEANRQFAELPMPTKKAKISEVEFEQFDELPPWRSSPAAAQAVTARPRTARRRRTADVNLPQVMESVPHPSLGQAEGYARRYPRRDPNMPRTPPFQGERLYTQDELPDVDEIDWQSGEDFVFNLPASTPYVGPRETLRHGFRQMQAYFPSTGIAAVTTPALMTEEPEFEDIDISFEKAEATVKKQETAYETVKSIDQQEESVPALGGVPVTTPKRTPSPRRRQMEWDESPPFATSPPLLSPSEQPQPFGLPAVVGIDRLPPLSEEALQIALNQAILETPHLNVSPARTVSPRRAAVVSPRGAAALSPRGAAAGAIGVCGAPGVCVSPARDTTPIKTIMSPKAGPSFAVSPSAAAVMPQQMPVTPGAFSPKITTRKTLPDRGQYVKRPAIPSWSPEIPAVQRVQPSAIDRVTVPEATTATEFLFPSQMLQYEQAPSDIFGDEDKERRRTPPRPPEIFQYEELASPEPAEGADLIGTSPPLQQLLEAYEIPAEFKDPSRPKMKKFVHYKGRRVPVAKQVGAVNILETIPERQQITEHRPRKTPPQKPPRQLTDTEEYFIQEFADPKQQELVRRAMLLIADVETDEPLPYLRAELPTAPPLDIPIPESAVQLTTVSPPRFHEFSEEAVQRQYAELGLKSPEAPCGPAICQGATPAIVTMDPDLEEFEALEAAIQNEQRQLTPPSVPRPRSPTTPPIPYVPTQADIIAQEAAGVRSFISNIRTPPSVPRRSPRTPPIPWVPTQAEIPFAHVVDSPVLTRKRLPSRKSPMLDYTSTPASVPRQEYLSRTPPIPWVPTFEEIIGNEALNLAADESGEYALQMESPPEAQAFPFLIDSPVLTRKRFPPKISPKVLDYSSTPPSGVCPGASRSPSPRTPPSIRKRTTRRIISPPGAEQVLPERLQTSIQELSPRSRRMQDLTRQYKDLFNEAQYLPDDLIGTEHPIDTHRPGTLLDVNIEDQGLQSPLRPDLRMHDWTTPEHLRPQYPATFQRPLAPAHAGVRRTSPPRVTPIVQRTSPQAQYVSPVVKVVPPPSPRVSPVTQRVSPYRKSTTPERKRISKSPQHVPVVPQMSPDLDEFERLERELGIDVPEAAKSPRGICPAAISPTMQQIVTRQEKALYDSPGDEELDEFERLEREMAASPRVSPQRARTPPKIPSPAAAMAVISAAQAQYEALKSPVRSPTGLTPPGSWGAIESGIAEEEIPYEFIQESPRGITPPTSWVAADDYFLAQETLDNLITSPTEELRSPMIPSALNPAVFPSRAPGSAEGVDLSSILPSPRRYVRDMYQSTPIVGQMGPAQQITPTRPGAAVKRPRRIDFDQPEPQERPVCPAARRSPAQTPIGKMRKAELEQMLADIPLSPIQPTAAIYSPARIEYSSPYISPVLPSTRQNVQALVAEEEPVYMSPTSPRATPPAPSRSPTPSRSPSPLPQTPFAYLEETEVIESLSGTEAPDLTSPARSPLRGTPPAAPEMFPYVSPNSPGISPEFRRRVESHTPRSTPAYHRKKRVMKQRMTPKLLPMEESREPRSPPTVHLGTLVQITPEDRIQRQAQDVYRTAEDQYAALLEDSQPHQPAQVVSDPLYDEYEEDVHPLDRPILFEERIQLPFALTDRRTAEIVSPPLPERSISPNILYSPIPMAPLIGESPPRGLSSPGYIEETEEEEVISSPGSRLFDNIQEGEDNLLDVDEGDVLLESPPRNVYDYGPEALPSPIISYTPPPLYDFQQDFYAPASPQRYDYGPETVPSPMLGYTPPHVYDYGPETVPSPMLSYTPSKSPLERKRFKERVARHDVQFPRQHRRVAEPPRLIPLHEETHESPYRCVPRRLASPKHVPRFPLFGPGGLIEETEEVYILPEDDLDDSLGRRLNYPYTDEEIREFKFLDY